VIGIHSVSAGMVPIGHDARGGPCRVHL